MADTLIFPCELPAHVESVRRRLAQHIQEELLPFERAQGIREGADVAADVRRRVRLRSEELGFFRLALPRADGGEGFDALGLTVVREEIARSGSILARFLLGRGPGILRYATGQQRQRYLEPVLRGERSYAFAFTEPRQGTGPDGARTTAVQEGDQYRLNGTKAFVTEGPQADFLLVLANIVLQNSGEQASAMLLVERDLAGVEMGTVMATMDGGSHCVFHFRDVQLPAGSVLGEVGQGMPRALENIGLARLSLAATASGAALRVLEMTLAHTAQPHRSGTPLAQREQVQAMLADMAADTLMARTVTYSAAAAVSAGAQADVETALAKLLATEAAGRVIDRAIQLHGAAAYVKGHPLEHLYRVARGWRIAEGTSEILKLSAARGLLQRQQPQ